MKLRLLVVGRMIPELAGFESRISKRLTAASWQLEVVELAEGRGKQSTQRMQDEEKNILKVAGPEFILLDERGKSLTSRQWSNFFEQKPGNAQLDMVIGGADGVSDRVRQLAAHIWSLSPLTLPHQLARVLVVEQFYRAYTISAGHPYHRD
ncbi:MAG: hypothetical protein CO186_02695 [Zetaproteobacteria bacterium CG_4_9_14_3_um_filter_49_83]|nr:MAG: hypothetical protein AUJ56_04045 [Zetaproteobacteria bacterium CG1_02_49_23]PIQ30472.1 MAG: hypothetical protein COW62_12280 [Zetaproteobacteria bacterium CG17_big_fil_post_rev_8_21_14_2_50_50_13]PIV29079.1 MAG: hypothetical protein COS35_13910 [Zetaproteobacteria bacterium CG02_land_8_20_14_3_00_50_9]PIY55254.1 MAG: hypothetical protein COZ00_10115 [Zetaproteobacteria bacterium CG_4_10_14_0_8_um_filter_49_80]PJA36066.1 MAG: hypothetical protein CO186_02695 [Zetaproteobacteria bacterium